MNTFEIGMDYDLFIVVKNQIKKASMIESIPARFVEYELILYNFNDYSTTLQDVILGYLADFIDAELMTDANINFIDNFINKYYSVETEQLTHID